MNTEKNKISLKQSSSGSLPVHGRGEFHWVLGLFRHGVRCFMMVIRLGFCTLFFHFVLQNVEVIQKIQSYPLKWWIP